ncbi:hypothetical protein [Bradyrhizobium guangdongense]|nr:hypothetical protein [Bradyrhizobium guangdongense]
MTPDHDIQQEHHRLYVRDMRTIFFAVLVIVAVDAVMIMTHQISP